MMLPLKFLAKARHLRLRHNQLRLPHRFLLRLPLQPLQLLLPLALVPF
jgi:hypothetical protein